LLDNRPNWVEHLQLVKQWILQNEQVLLADLMWIKDRLNQLPADKAVYGMVHYDFESDNILWDKGKPGIIDFDDSSYYWYVADFAIALRELFNNRIEQINFNDRRFQAFLGGYL
jgi:Ser/Thr protein kinase RdoA (MazF antagonist)